MNSTKPTREEADAIKRASFGYVIEAEMRKRLIEKGWIKQVVGGLSVTTDGKKHIGSGL